MFITFEGIDGSGKSTQIQLLQEHLEEEGHLVDVYREPGGTEVSELIRDILLNPQYEIDDVTETLLFSSARSQLVAREVLPKLAAGHIVILDRFYDSTTAYQGYGRRSLELDQIRLLNRIASHTTEPNITVYLRVPLEVARQRNMGKQKDRMEQSGKSFYEKVIRGFDELAEQNERFFTVDSTQKREEVHRKIWEHVIDYL